MPFRTLSFGDLETGVWGSAWSLDDGRGGFCLFGDAAAARSLEPPATIVVSDDQGAWELTGQGVELRCVPAAEPAAVSGGFDHLAHVHGRLSALGAERELDCLGRCGARDALAPQEFESVRDVAAWFEPDQGLAVLAARPRGASSHAQDVLSASAFEEGHSLALNDSRLSTTYLAAGLPARASFELWPEPVEAADDESLDEAEEPRPRRAAGEAIGPGASYEGAGLSVRGAPFRFHSRGRPGAGVYVLARTR